jgi:non-specific serine/threonine protein kinase
MFIVLSISPHGRLFVEESDAEGVAALGGAAGRRVAAAFAESAARGLLHLATAELQTHLPPAFAFARDFAREYLTRVCHTPAPDGPRSDEPGRAEPLPAPDHADLAATVLRAPPMRGLEYLGTAALASWWAELDALVRAEASATPGGVAAYLRERNPLWRLVGRVTFHLAENKRDPDHPFAFMATYATRLSAQGRVQHLPLGRALQEYAGAKRRGELLSLLTPVQRAAERSGLAKELVESGDVYHPLAWAARDAYRFLRDVPTLEEAGLIVRVPDWWKPARPPRPVVSVKVAGRPRTTLGADALLEFSVGAAVDGEPLSEAELRSLLTSEGGLVNLKGRWVEVDRDKLAAALEHWKKVEREARGGGVTFFEGMRLLAGAPLPGDAAAAAPEDARQWTGISASGDLEETLRRLRDPQSLAAPAPPDLRADLRPYQQTGVNWLRFMTRLGLGACLADDMGLGKTVQVIALLLHLRRERDTSRRPQPPSLLVVPASLIGNWKSELARFAPTLVAFVAHPSESDWAANDDASPPATGDNVDLVITTYTMLSRLAWLREREWALVILDEAQAIKNSGARQTRAVKELKAAGRVALTGTPVENRLSDLWSLFDFLNPGLLGGPKAFSEFAKRLAAKETGDAYRPLRTLVGPYILRRLKTDKRVIADLPDKTEVNAYCGLGRRQAALYEQTVRELAEQLQRVDGIQRRGLVLAYLMRLKQVCNHPSQLSGDGRFDPDDSGKFRRLAELCEELAERQEKALVFTQFREMTAPLADFLAGVFRRPGLVLHGQTPVAKRRELVEAFQREQGPPFFVLSLKAGGTGLNLTEASHVIHFDRWWNPAVESQATDRAFRIGQKRNVLVHKFVCRGTVEDRIDDLIRQKMALARDVLDGGGEVLITEMDNEQLLRLVSLDIAKALDA